MNHATRSPLSRQIGGIPFRLGVLFALSALTLASPLPASAAYCGSPADAAAVEAAALSHGPAGKTRIMDVLVVQDYARVDIQSKGRVTQYYMKDCGRWIFLGNDIPEDAPPAVGAKFKAFVTRDDGGTECLNPSYVDHPSAP